MMNIVYRDPSATYAYVGMSAYKLVRLSYSDEDLLGMAPLPESELGLDPDLTDVAFCASIAAAGGAWWENVGVDLRRSFWLEYLDSAAQALADELALPEAAEG